MSDIEAIDTETPEATEEAPKPKRGRPRKTDADKETAEKKSAAKKTKKADDSADPEASDTEEKPKAKRTRKKATDDASLADAGSDAKAAKKASEKSEKPKDDSAADSSDAPQEAKPKRTRAKKAASEEASGEEAESEKGASSKKEGEKSAEQTSDAKQSDDASDEERGDAKKQFSKRQSRTHQVKTSRSDNSNSRHQNQQNNRNQQNGRNQNHRQRRGRVERQQREYVPSVSREELDELKLPELREKAAELNIDASGMKKAEMIDAIYEALAIAEGFIEVGGILDILQDGYGFLRTNGYLPSERDVYVGLSTIRRNGLRKGDYVTGQTRPAREGEKFAAIQKIYTINGVALDDIGHRPKFSDLTPVFPDERFVMEHGKDTITARVIDLAAPIGKGQRGLIVSPPKAGKTTVLKDIAASISANNPEAHLMCLLVDERPEEVTDMERSINGEVIASTFDMPSENHIAVSELVIERAKRLVEQGEDVVILLDSITRLARAYNLAQPASGRILSGGVDSTALYPPKRFLGAARNIEGGGSLTILASALIDTGSKMDEVIFEEFKGTGNMELKLDRNLADRRIFPAIDPITSGTRKEELLLDNQEAPLIWAVRRILANTNNTERSMDMLIKSLKQTETNQEFLLKTAKRAQKQGRMDENMDL